MFRALHLFKSGATRATLEPPLSVTLIDKDDTGLKSVDLAISPENIFTTAVGRAGKRTLASWHVTTPAEIIEHMLYLVNGVGTNNNL